MEERSHYLNSGIWERSIFRGGAKIFVPCSSRKLASGETRPDSSPFPSRLRCLFPWLRRKIKSTRARNLKLWLLAVGSLKEAKIESALKHYLSNSFPTTMGRKGFLLERNASVLYGSSSGNGSRNKQAKPERNCGKSCVCAYCKQHNYQKENPSPVSKLWSWGIVRLPALPVLRRERA